MNAQIILMLLMALAIAAPSRGETLREVLEKNAIPLSSFDLAELDARVSSGAVSSNAGVVMLAYPTQSTGELIGPPMHVVSYERSLQKLVHRAITAAETSDECFGSALGISEQGGFILVETHVNPSASCTLVLDAELRVRHTLFAWVVARLGPHGILFEEDEIHFAPAHPMRLEVYALDTGRMQEVYPPDGDPLRAQFSRDLKQHLPPESWCREENHNCDTSFFDEDRNGSVWSDAAGTKFAFVAYYGAAGFGEEADREIGTRSVLYVYRRRAEGWIYCEEELSDEEVHGRQEQLKHNFEEATQHCSRELDVTVKPHDSPFSHLK